MTEKTHQQPEHWSAIRLKRVFTDYFGGSWGDDVSVSDPKNLVRVVRVSEFDMNRLRLVDEIPTIRSLELDDSSRKLLKKNDVVLEKSGGGEKTPVGRSVLFDKDPELPTINSNFTNLFRPDLKKVDPRFLVYSLYSSYLSGQTARNIKQTTGIQNLDIDDYLTETILLPPLDEQRLISRYLDKKTQQIDTLIEKIEKKIELLKEQRTSLINHYVTKGLDPNVEMKDSGVEWIGKIPKHWDVTKLKRITKKIGSGVTPKGGSDVYSEVGIPFLRSQNVHFDGLHLDDVVFISEEIDESMSGTRVRRNDILFNITGGSIGRCCLTETDITMNVNQHVCIVRPSDRVSPRFLVSVLASVVGQEQVIFNLTGSGREGLNFENLGDFQIPLPNGDEQALIGEKISRLRERYFDLESLLQRQITKNIEYRQSLISSVVTGKVRVTEDLV